MISVSCTLICCQPASGSSRSLLSAHQSCLAVPSAALQQKWSIHSIRGDWHMRQRHENGGWRPFWSPCQQPGSVLNSYCNLWLSAHTWMNSRRSAVWSVIRHGWFKVEMKCPANANWAHIIIWLKGGGFKARLQTKNNWKVASFQRTAEVPLSKATNPQMPWAPVWGWHDTCARVFICMFKACLFLILKKRECLLSWSAFPAATVVGAISVSHFFITSQRHIL